MSGGAAPDAPPGPRAVAFPWAPLAAAAILAGIAFTPGVRDMVGRWLAVGSYYGHGPLVPLVCGWLVWRDRARLAAIPRSSCPFGPFVVLGASLVNGASVIWDVHFTQNFSLVAAIVGIALTLLGPALVRAVWFPLAYLCFMVPLPEIAIANITFELKILAAEWAVAAMELAGVPVVLEGSSIHMSSTSALVGDVCSGLRTLVSLLGLAAIFAYLERGRLRATLTVLLAGPIAILANVARILLLCWLASIGSSAAREGPLHELTGLAVYAVALLLLFAIRAVPGGDEEPATPRVEIGPVPHTAPPAWRVVVMLTALALGAANSVAFGLSPVAIERTERTRHVPATIGPWTGTDLPIEPRVYQLLETEDIIIRRYARAAEPIPVDLYIVHAADSRKVAHPPEICFSGGGYQRREAGNAALDASGLPVPAVRMVLDHGRHALLVYYWYRLDGRDTADYLEHQLAYVVRRLKREHREGSMIRLSTPIAPGPDGLRDAEARIAAFAREALPGVLGRLP